MGVKRIADDSTDWRERYSNERLVCSTYVAFHVVSSRSTNEMRVGLMGVWGLAGQHPRAARCGWLKWPTAGGQAAAIQTLLLRLAVAGAPERCPSARPQLTCGPGPQAKRLHRLRCSSSCKSRRPPGPKCPACPSAWLPPSQPAHSASPQSPAAAGAEAPTGQHKTWSRAPAARVAARMAAAPGLTHPPSRFEATGSRRWQAGCATLCSPAQPLAPAPPQDPSAQHPTSAAAGGGRKTRWTTQSAWAGSLRREGGGGQAPWRQCNAKRAAARP